MGITKHGKRKEIGKEKDEGEVRVCKSEEKFLWNKNSGSRFLERQDSTTEDRDSSTGDGSDIQDR